MLFKSFRRREHNGGLLLYPAAHRNTEYVQSLRLRRPTGNMDDMGHTVTLISDVICFHIFNDFFLLGCTSIFPVFQFVFLFYLPRWHFHLNKSVLLFSITDRHNTTWDLRRVHESSLLVSPNTCSPVEKLRASTLSDRSFGLRRNVWWGHWRRSRGIVDIKRLNVI